jgi:hypothetical protein
MKQIKLKDLYEACKKQMEKGNGDKTLVVANDNEGNEYHGMFFTISACDESWRNLIIDSQVTEPSDLLVVG